MATTYSSIGDQNLHAIQEAGAFTDWMYAQIRPHIQGCTLEIGSGTGTYSAKLIRDFPGQSIILTDIDPVYVQQLQATYQEKTNISCRELNLDDQTPAPDLIGKVDTIVMLNVLEHIENDEQALRALQELLSPEGRLIVLVPAHPCLYNVIDKAVGHFRRYTRARVESVTQRASLQIESLFFFNAVSIIPWWIQGSLLKQPAIRSGSLTLFDRLVPVFALIERFILRKKVGISLITVLKKA